MFIEVALVTILSVSISLGCKITTEDQKWANQHVCVQYNVIPNEEDCRDLCHNYDNWHCKCVGYTWFSQDNVCYLYRDVQTELAPCSEQCKTGTEPTILDNKGCQPESAVDIISTYPVDSFQQCLNDCISNSNCRHFNYDKSGCQLLRSCGVNLEDCGECQTGSLTCLGAELPEQCLQYNELDDSSRNVQSSDGRNCDNAEGVDWYNTSPDWKGEGWYRFVPPAGTRLPTSSPGANVCSSMATGWSQDAHPQNVGEQKDIEVCFHHNGFGECHEKITASVINCEEYFIYNFKTPPSCVSRYCGMD